MFVQILIYVYLGICAGMILFNIVTALLSQRREHRSFRDGIRLELTVSQELDRLAETERSARGICASWSADCAA